VHADEMQRPDGAGEAAGAALAPLEELLSLWDGSHVPLGGIVTSTKSEALALFKLYQQGLGETRSFRPDRRLAYARSYPPDKKAILGFVGAYLLLKRGEQARAAQTLRELTRRYPNFPDPWVWLSATTDDLDERIDCLENAVLVEPSHPLAREALAIAQGKVSRSVKGSMDHGQQQTVQAKCPQCGGGLRYEPGATSVSCPYCGHLQQLEQANVVDGDASLLRNLQLRRRMQGQEWREARRVVHCRACGAELTMSRHLAKECVFCGSSSVLAEDSQLALEQPDGFLPFKLDEDQAIAAVEKTQRSAMGRIKTWWIGERQKLQGLHAVYLPFWLFDGIVEVRKPVLGQVDQGSDWAQAVWTSFAAGAVGDSPAERLSVSVEGDQEKRSALLKKNLIIFDNLLYSAIDFPPWWLLRQVLPFHLQVVVPYEPQLLADWPAVLHQRDVEEVVQQACNTMLAKAVWRNKSLALSQASDFAELRRTFQVTTVTYQLLLLPVWVGLGLREKEQRLVLVNGQTGNVVWSSPLRPRQEP
jgi:predicted RNA-binding Zn-ribbon protein involved in translation (DUF1610 family)